MKNIITILALSVSLFSCASSDRFWFSTPRADSSVYFEYSLRDVLSVNIAGEDAFEEDTGDYDSKYRMFYYNHGYYDRNPHIKYFHIASDVYLLYDENQYIFLSDDEGNSKHIIDERNFNDEYNIIKNGDYDPRKIYRVKYTLSCDSRDSTDYNSIKIDSIEGLLTYEEYRKLEREKEEQERIVQEKEYVLQIKTDYEAAYQNALNQTGVSGLAAFILDNHRLLEPDWYKYKRSNNIKWDDDIIEECRKEIARRLTNNQNVTFAKIGGMGNPYSFDKTAIYNCPYYIGVRQWRTDGSLLCYLDDDAFIIDKVPDITKIGNSIRNAYLQYKGATEVRFVNGSNEMIAVFDLLYYF
jgi:hypothetical protein